MLIIFYHVFIQPFPLLSPLDPKAPAPGAPRRRATPPGAARRRRRTAARGAAAATAAALRAMHGDLGRGIQQGMTWIKEDSYSGQIISIG